MHGSAEVVRPSVRQRRGNGGRILGAAAHYASVKSSSPSSSPSSSSSTAPLPQTPPCANSEDSDSVQRLRDVA